MGYSEFPSKAMGALSEHGCHLILDCSSKGTRVIRIHHIMASVDKTLLNVQLSFCGSLEHNNEMLEKLLQRLKFISNSHYLSIIF